MRRGLFSRVAKNVKLQFTRVEQDSGKGPIYL